MAEGGGKDISGIEKCVGIGFGIGSAIDHKGVCEELPFFGQLPVKAPDERIDPVDRTGNISDGLEPKVTAPEVRHLVEQYEAEAVLRPIFGPVRERDYRAE